MYVCLFSGIYPQPYVGGHSNTERGYLVHLKERLESELAGTGDVLEVQVSQNDKDPLVVV